MTREEAIEILKRIMPTPKRGDGKSEFNLLISIALSMAIKALEQEPKTDMLDKIRAEIEQEYNKYRNMSEKWGERACGIGTTLEIIDKYKAESEDGK